MSPKHVEAPRPAAPVDEVVAVLGGVPLPEPVAPDEGERAIRKRRKHDAKLRQDAERAPRSFERFRILMDVVDQGRRVADLCDHKARYALVVMGALNAGVVFLMSRAHLMAELSAGVKPWVIGLLVTYAGASFVFVFHAIDCLRPRRLRYATGQPQDSGDMDAVERHRPSGSRIGRPLPATTSRVTAGPGAGFEWNSSTPRWFWSLITWRGSFEPSISRWAGCTGG